MASSEEDGAPEAGEDREAPRRRRRLGLLATAWLTFYNVAMTAGWLVLAIAMLYFHMLRQRRKVLHGEVIVEKDE